MQRQMRSVSQELCFEDAACLRDAILQLQNQQKESGARTQSHNLACLSAAPASHRASAGLPQLNLDLLDPGDSYGVSTFGSETGTLDLNGISTVAT